MPLHLLGKKSWNVYNSKNIARVQRDEAEARAKEEDEECRMQEADAERRLDLLRGADFSKTDSPQPELVQTYLRQERNHNRKRRRLAGEDDTERDIRLAREDIAESSHHAQSLPLIPPAKSIVDHNGHITLFPEYHKKRGGKNEDAEAESAKREREFEDQYTMRFSNAANNKTKSGKPWYTDTVPSDLATVYTVSKDVWGNEDLGRHKRDQQRTSSIDPLAVMKKGVKQLREAEKHRKEWMKRRERDLSEVEELARRHQESRRRGSNGVSLEKFNLDDHRQRSPHHARGSGAENENRHRRHHRRRHHRRHSDKPDKAQRHHQAKDHRSRDIQSSFSPRDAS